MAEAKDRDWLVPSAILTASLMITALSLMPFLGFHDLPDPIFSLSGWLKWTLICAGLVVSVRVVKMMRRGLDRPAARLLADAREYRIHVTTIALAMLLGALDLYAFMIIKPELNVLFPFWADQMLADLDSRIFGTDPWRLFPGWDRPIVGYLYSLGWYLSLLVTLFWLAIKQPSAGKSAGLLSYFVIWTLFGPITQALFSSAGPIFFSRIGLGGRFEDIPTGVISQTISDYLWTLFETRSLAPGAGISAMPSMHIATIAWLVICLAWFRSRWTVPAIVFALFIYAGSVALGWHYASDGIVGAAGAGLSFYLAQWYVSRRTRTGHIRNQPALGLDLDSVLQSREQRRKGRGS